MIFQVQTVTGNIQKELTEPGEEISGDELVDPSYIPEETTD